MTPSHRAYRLHTLGGLRLEGVESPLADYARHPRRLALLAVVVLAGPAGARRDQLLTLFWSESDEARARGALNQLLYNLRRDLGDVVSAGGPRLTADPVRLSADVIDFRSALARGDDGEAAALYAGPFLDGFSPGGAPEFEHWADEQREHLRREARAALERLVARTPRDEGALGWWRQLTEVDPHDGRAALGYMEALAASGDRSAALRHWAAYERRMRADLDAAPEPAVAGYAARLRQHASLVEPPLPDPVAWRSGDVPTTDGSTPEPSRRAVTSRRRPAWILGAGAAALLSLLVLRPRIHPPASPHQPRLVVARFQNQTSDSALDAAGQLMADWLTERIEFAQLGPVIDARSARASTDNAEAAGPTDSVVRARLVGKDAGADRVLSGSYRRSGDTLLVSGYVVEVPSGRMLTQLPQVTVPDGDPSLAADLMAERALGALGQLHDERRGDLVVVSRHAPRYAAYRAFREGMDLALAYRGAEAVERYREAYRLDTSFVAPLIWMADAAESYGELRAADSVLREADRRRDRLSPLDRAMLDFNMADLRGDRAGALAAARTMGQLAPGSEADFLLGMEALRAQRPREALAAFRRVVPDRGFLKGWDGYWGWPMQAWLLAGEPDSALAAARDGVRHHPSSRQALLHVILVRAASGDTAALWPLFAQADALPPGDGGLPTPRIIRAAAAQLAGYGFAAEARATALRGLPLLDANDRSEDGDANRLTLVEFYYLLGRYREARPIIEQMARRHPDEMKWTGLKALVAARLGDSATALAIDRALAGDRSTAGYGLRAFWRARIHAALGHREQMLGLLGATLASSGGDLDPSAIRIAADFIPFHADPAYQALMRPRD